jgi:Ni/Fe-hydrogenase subunit HybB-like protein
MCLVAIAIIHLVDVHGKFEEVAYIGVLFIGLIVASLVLAEALLRSDDSWVWMAACLLAAGTIAGYVLSRSVGLPGEGGAEKGNWWEGLGLASLLVEATVVWLAATRLARRETI